MHEQYDAIGTLIAKDGWRKPSPYTSTERFRTGDRIRLKWTGEAGLPHIHDNSRAEVLRVNRKRLRIRVIGCNTILHIYPSQVLEICERPVPVMEHTHAG